MILHGVIRPGERINIKQLEERFGVSHIPIREALRKLEAEGLTDILPQRGAAAARVSAQELDDIYDLRAIIEPEVAHRAVLSAGEDERQLVLDASRNLEEVEKGTDQEAFFGAHAKLHWALLAPGSTGEIERVLRHLSLTAERYIRLTRLAAGDEAHRQHGLMVRAFTSADADELRRLVKLHLGLTADAFRAAFADPSSNPMMGLMDPPTSSAK